MYRKYTVLLALSLLVLGAARLCVEGTFVNRAASREAFSLSGGGEGALQATSYLGVSGEQISTQRVVDMNILMRKTKIHLTETEYGHLLRIVEAEAGGEDKMGKMLVANVVLNRVEHEDFPNTVTEVIFQANNGQAQFSPVSDGRFYTVNISEETREAVDAALRGEDNSQGALYFAARESADEDKMRWFDEGLNRLFAYGGHEFFK